MAFLVHVKLRRRYRLALMLVGLTLAFVLGLALALPAVGDFLVVADPLAPVDAIFVLDGMTPTRELEGAALYHRQLAPYVVLSRGYDLTPVARQLAGEPTRQERAARVLAHVRVPPAAIIRLEHEADNTAQELAIAFDYARTRGFRRVILVTSPFHTRRVRTIWNMRYQRTIPALVTPTSYETWDTRRWWRSRHSLEYGVHELGGIVHFLIGSPLPTFDRAP